MKITTYGTRGSVPIANPNSVKFGGNTTCLRVESACLPPGFVLAIDAGSGFVPLSQDVLKEGGAKEVAVLFTHYHHDHTQGLFLSPLAYMRNIKKYLLGPEEHEVGPKQVMEAMMRPPYFPVHFTEIVSSFKFKGLDFPQTMVILLHNEGGYKLMGVDEYQARLNKSEYFGIGQGKYPLSECLVITMLKSRHSEQTISYRFEEKLTGKVFVFMTDHENEDSIPTAKKAFAAGADLLIMDSQYSRVVYEARTGGWGHGTPDYCVRFAEAVGAKALGLTHHDPSSSDTQIEAILAEAKAAAKELLLFIFACADYQVSKL